MKLGFWNVVKDVVRKSDVVLEMVDARFPELTRLGVIEKYAKSCHKHLIIVLNKMDLLSSRSVQQIKNEFRNENVVFVSSKFNRNIFELIGTIKSITKKDAPTVCIIGYPNTGKSTLINKLSKGGKVRTSTESGFTRGKQLIRGRGNIMLIDTPGIVPYEARDEIRLGLVSGISPAKLEDPALVAFELLSIFKFRNPEALQASYGLDPQQEADEMLETLAEKWNMRMKKGVIDERRAAIKLLNDWHDGVMKL